MIKKRKQLPVTLKTLRTNRHLKQSDIAKYLGVSVSAYSHYECGERTPGVDALLLLAKLHKIKISYLIFLACNDIADEENITTSDIYDLFSTEITLSYYEQTILNIYRTVPDIYKQNILLFCEAAIECME